MDTSAAVLAFDRRTRRGRKAAELLASRADKVVSELFLLELSSALSRRDDLLSAIASEGVTPSVSVVAYVLYMMTKHGLKLIESPPDMVFTPAGRVSASAGWAMSHASEFRLKALDLLHLAQLFVLKERGYPIDSILTSDEEFLKVKEALKRLGVAVVASGH